MMAVGEAQSPLIFSPKCPQCHLVSRFIVCKSHCLSMVAFVTQGEVLAGLALDSRSVLNSCPSSTWKLQDAICTSVMVRAGAGHHWGEHLQGAEGGIGLSAGKDLPETVE